MPRAADNDLNDTATHLLVAALARETCGRVSALDLGHNKLSVSTVKVSKVGGVGAGGCLALQERRLPAHCPPLPVRSPCAP